MGCTFYEVTADTQQQLTYIHVKLAVRLPAPVFDLWVPAAHEPSVCLNKTEQVKQTVLHTAPHADQRECEEHNDFIHFCDHSVTPESYLHKRIISSL